MQVLISFYKQPVCHFKFLRKSSLGAHTRLSLFYAYIYIIILFTIEILQIIYFFLLNRIICLFRHEDHYTLALTEPSM